MKLEAIDTSFTEVLDGMAFTMRYGASRVIVIVANETLVRQGLPYDPDHRGAFLDKHLAEWQQVASAKFVRGDYENRGLRVRILPRDLALAEPLLRAAG